MKKILPGWLLFSVFFIVSTQTMACGFWGNLDEFCHKAEYIVIGECVEKKSSLQAKLKIEKIFKAPKSDPNPKILNVKGAGATGSQFSFKKGKRYFAFIFKEGRCFLLGSHHEILKGNRFKYVFRNTTGMLICLEPNTDTLSKLVRQVELVLSGKYKKTASDVRDICVWRLIQKIKPEILSKANAILPNYTAPWCKSGERSDIIVDAKFVRKEEIGKTPTCRRTTTAYLYTFEVTNQIKGKFPHSQIRFIRILSLREGVKYKLLTLKGNLRFQLSLEYGDYWINNITPIPKEGKQSESIDMLPDAQVTALITKLHRFIVPPEGTSEADVVTVYGSGKVINKPQKGKYVPSMYPMHTYKLLPASNLFQDYRVFLYINYQNGKVRRADLNHICQTNGRPAGIDHCAEIAKENRQVLKDLIEIKHKYGSKLKNASWNRHSNSISR